MFAAEFRPVVPAAPSPPLADACPEGQVWCFFRQRCVPLSEVGPMRRAFAQASARNMFGLDTLGQPSEEFRRTAITMWVVGSALTLGVIGLGVFLALRAGRGAERIATKYIEAKHGD